jgi:oxygen-independent coproporphyrinogen-3 oxidase
MLGLRLSDGLELSALSEAAQTEALRSAAAGHLDPASWERGKLVLTREGRLLADAIVRDLT